MKSCNMKGKYKSVFVVDVDGRCENAIIIDDDDDDDGTDKKDDPEVGVESVGDLDSDASSRKSCPAPDFIWKSAGLDDDDFRFFREKKSAFKLSKCKKTYTGNTRGGKYFGLSPESEDSSSKSDCSNCELMEGSVGKLQEQLVKAFHRKKCNFRNGQSGLADRTSASGSRSDTPVVEDENKTIKHAETHASSGSSESNIQKQKSSVFETNNDNYLGGTCLTCRTERPFVESDKEVDHGSFSQSQYGPTSEAQFSHVHADVTSGRERFMKDPLPRDRNQKFCRASSNCNLYPSDLQHGETLLNGKEKLQSKEPSVPIPKLSEVADGLPPSDVEVGTVFDESASIETQFGGIPVFSSKNYCDTEKVVSGDSSQNEETQINQSFYEAKQSSIISMSNCKKYDKKDTFHVLGVDATAFGKRDIIMDREKLKETYEYKRAMEEEWASRQRELKIQAEEARRLRKRRKAESMHLLNMERRQKQCLEEMRETEKKDEEILNLKERLRIEIRSELSKLEISCIDMVSLLRSLGIPVDGGIRPLPKEVHAAYKQALLRFHPDRASKTDIRQQVEAEEKFKLISRMKEKF